MIDSWSLPINQYVLFGLDYLRHVLPLIVSKLLLLEDCQDLGKDKDKRKALSIFCTGQVVELLTWKYIHYIKSPESIYITQHSARLSYVPHICLHMGMKEML